MTAPTRPRLGHVHLEVRDLERSVDFYRRLVGLDLTEEVAGRFAFLSFGDQHHDLALQQIASPPDDASATDRLSCEHRDTRPGLYHLAFELPSDEALERVAELLRSEGRLFEVVDHGISHALYSRDPDGHGVEVYVDRRHRAGGRRSWGGQTKAAPISSR